VEYGPCVVYGKGLGDGFASFLNGEFLRKWRELLYEETKSNIKKMCERCGTYCEFLFLYFFC